MLTIPVLTAEQVGDFHRDGFVLVPGGFDAAAIARIRGWMEALAAMPEAPGKHWVYHEKSLVDPGAELINRIEYFSPFHPGFAELAATLRAPVAQLLGEPAILFKEKVNFKMPGGDGFKPHQDSQAGWWRYARYFVTVMVSVDEATVENGCLELAAGHHKRGLFREWEPLTQEDMADMTFAPAPTKPGDLAFFDSYAPHKSEPNTSEQVRRLYFATYNGASEGDQFERYHKDKREAFPPDIERDPAKDYAFQV